MEQNPKIGLQSQNAHALCHSRQSGRSVRPTPIAYVGLNVATKCSIAVSQDMPMRVEKGILARLHCVVALS